MKSEKQPNSYSFQVVSVKMKVKFQCKMLIYYNSEPITSEVAPVNQHLFQFNQNMTLKQEDKNSCFILTLCLLTQKGAKYIAAEVYLYYSELIKANEGSLILSLVKCLDPEAQIQIRVNGVIYEKKEAKRDLQRDHKLTQVNEKWNVERRDENYKDFQSPLDTRSEMHYYDNQAFLRDRKPRKHYNKNRSRSKSRSILKKKSPQYPPEPLSSAADPTIYSIRDKYRQSYEKMKNKIKTQYNKNIHDFEQKVTLENNEVLMKLRTKYSWVYNQLELTQQKLRSLEQTHNSEMTKMNNELSRWKNEAENEKVRKNEEKQKSSKLQLQFNQLQMKVKYSDEKSEKQVKSLRDQLSERQKSISHYKDENTKLLQKLNKLTQKQHEFCHSFEHLNYQNRGCHRVIEQLQGEVNEYKSRIKELQSKCQEAITKSDFLKESKEQMNGGYKKMEEQLKKLSEDYYKQKKEGQKIRSEKGELETHVKMLQSQIDGKEKQINAAKETMNQDEKSLSSVKENLLRCELDLKNFEKQNEKFKQHLFSTIQLLFSNPEQGNLGKSLNLAEYKDKVPETEKSSTQIMNQISSYSKEYKQMINKLSEENKELNRENQQNKKKLEELSAKTKQQLAENQIHIQQLEQELSKTCHDKEDLAEKMTQEIQFLKTKVQQYETELNHLTVLHEENLFTLNGLKTDKEIEASLSEGAIKQLQKKIKILEEKIVEHQSSQQILQNFKHNLEIQIEKLTENNGQLAEEIQRKNVQLADDIKQIELKDKSIEDFKFLKKKNTSQILQLQIMLTNEKQKNEKNVELIREQERKSQQSKNFINELIKQKEILLKSELQKIEEIGEMQNKIQTLNEEINGLTENLSEKSTLLSDQKATTKKQQLKIKALEEEKEENKNRNKKLTQKLMDKEKQLKKIEDLKWQLEENYKKYSESRQKEVKELQEQIERKQKEFMEKVKKISQKEGSFLEELEEKQREIEECVKERLLQNEQLDALVKEIHLREDEILFLKNANQEWEKKAILAEKKNRELDEQQKKAQEKMYILSQEITQFQILAQQKKFIHNGEINSLNENWEFKVDSICQDYEIKLELVENEREYFRGKSQQYENEVKKMQERMKEIEGEKDADRQLGQEKLRKLDEDKTAMILNLKAQVEHLHHEISESQSKLKKQIASIESLENVALTKNDTIKRLEKRIEEYEEKIQKMIVTHCTEIAALNKRDLELRKYEQAVSNYQWVTEREIKRQLQQITQRIISQYETEGGKKVILESIKQMEKSMMRIVERKIMEAKL